MHQNRYQAVVFAMLIAGGVYAIPASAANNAMQVCGAKYRAAKDAKTLPAGQTWGQFLAACRSTLPADAATPLPADKTVAGRPAAAKAPGQLSPAQLAERGRMKQCAAQWQSDKAAGKIATGQTWPRYWSACSARLKG